MIDWRQFKCRCSAITKMLSQSRSNPVLTELQCKKLADLEVKDKLTDNQKIELTDLLIKKENSKKIILSDTCIEYLMEHYSWVTAQKVAVNKEMDIEFTQKGKIVEEDSITLLSVVNKTFYQKNNERVSNDFLSGEPDVFTGDEIMKADKITDLKSVWDYPGFLKKINTATEPVYDTQVKGYMDITGAVEGEIAYCLVSMPETIINDYRRRLMYKMNVVTSEAPEYLEAVTTMERSMYFDDIPRHLRVWKVPVIPFNDFERQKVYDKVKICRDWLYSFDEMYQKINT